MEQYFVFFIVVIIWTISLFYFTKKVNNFFEPHWDSQYNQFRKSVISGYVMFLMYLVLFGFIDPTFINKKEIDWFFISRFFVLGNIFLPIFYFILKPKFNQVTYKFTWHAKRDGSWKIFGKIDFEQAARFMPNEFWQKMIGFFAIHKPDCSSIQFSQINKNQNFSASVSFYNEMEISATGFSSPTKINSKVVKEKQREQFVDFVKKHLATLGMNIDDYERLSREDSTNVILRKKDVVFFPNAVHFPIKDKCLLCVDYEGIQITAKDNFIEALFVLTKGNAIEQYNLAREFYNSFSPNYCVNIVFKMCFEFQYENGENVERWGETGEKPFVVVENWHYQKNKPVKNEKEIISVPEIMQLFCDWEYVSKTNPFPKLKKSEEEKQQSVRRMIIFNHNNQIMNANLANGEITDYYLKVLDDGKIVKKANGNGHVCKDAFVISGKFSDNCHDPRCKKILAGTKDKC
ncbi:MAG: hypothetical protein WCT18_01235 [Patescibacteria group bacterium]